MEEGDPGEEGEEIEPQEEYSEYDRVRVVGPVSVPEHVADVEPYVEMIEP